MRSATSSQNKLCKVCKNRVLASRGTAPPWMSDLHVQRWYWSVATHLGWMLLGRTPGWNVECPEEASHPCLLEVCVPWVGATSFSSLTLLCALSASCCVPHDSPSRTDFQSRHGSAGALGQECGAAGDSISCEVSQGIRGVTSDTEVCVPVQGSAWMWSSLVLEGQLTTSPRQQGV